MDGSITHPARRGFMPFVIFRSWVKDAGWELRSPTASHIIADERGPAPIDG
jgi:hypothetical protein